MNPAFVTFELLIISVRHSGHQRAREMLEESASGSLPALHLVQPSSNSLRCFVITDRTSFRIGETMQPCKTSSPLSIRTFARKYHMCRWSEAVNTGYMRGVMVEQDASGSQTDCRDTEVTNWPNPCRNRKSVFPRILHDRG